MTAITMGPPKAADVLRECLYRGADRAILLTDRRAAASDTLATSYILSQAVRTIGRFDLVFCGRQAIDGDTAQVGPQCAEKLGIPQITYLEELVGLSRRRGPRAAQHRPRLGDRRGPAAGAGDGDSTRPTAASAGGQAGDAVQAGAGRRRDAGEVKRDLPDRPRSSPAEAAAGRGAAARGLLIEQWDLDAIGADLDRCGLAGSPTKVHRVQSIVLTKQGYTQIPPTEEGVRPDDPRTGRRPDAGISPRPAAAARLRPE